MTSTAESKAADMRTANLVEILNTSAARQAGRALEESAAAEAAAALQQVSPSIAVAALAELEDPHRAAILAGADPDHAAQWERNAVYPEDSVGRLMDPALATFSPETTVAEATATLRDLVRRAFITYGWVVDADGRLRGLLVFRELLFASADQRVSEIMLRDPFALLPQTPTADAMKEVVQRHFPVYPACDESGHLVGVVRGQSLFQAQAFEISAQPGEMVGVDKEERVATPWPTSLKSRHPWLQLNLLTCFVAAFVVGSCQGTIDRIVILAAFLPVLAGQSGNTGCQALAVCLRAMTLGELKGAARRVVIKEAILGLLNGLLVGLVAGTGMWWAASRAGHPSAVTLGVIVLMAMVISCIVSGVSGAIIPQILKRFGADPATASSIFLTTATDVVSMGVFLGLATILVP